MACGNVDTNRAGLDCGRVHSHVRPTAEDLDRLLMRDREQGFPEADLQIPVSCIRIPELRVMCSVPSMSILVAQ